jgi:oxygen-independent coproporphyrinogen-3 oxidase
MDTAIQFDASLIRRYDTAGPRYTSYPTAAQFHGGFGQAHHRAAAQRSNEDFIPASLSLYVHIPFCDTVCYYCACNKVITKNHKHAEPYLAALQQEIDIQGTLFDHDRHVVQVHLGGGTPTFLSREQMAALMGRLRARFNLVPDDEGEISIEVDPRTVSADDVAHLRWLGFNRISLGVQDFDPEVQRAVNRIQSEEQTLGAIEAARHEGFQSVSVDLIYGLPHQTVERFNRTLDKIIAARPNRLSLFNYAHLPQRFKVQKQIDAAALPPPDEKLLILQHSISRLGSAGYVLIGMDHFALPDDELARAQQAGTLHRNFQGYSTHADCDLIGLGASAISAIGGTYSQNEHTPEDYNRAITDAGLATSRGLELDADDMLRREIIQDLMCQFEVNHEEISHAYGIRFRDYFEPEMDSLRHMADDGLLSMDSERIHVLPRGRLLIRNICMAFDRHLNGAGGFSRTI